MTHRWSESLKPMRVVLSVLLLAGVGCKPGTEPCGVSGRTCAAGRVCVDDTQDQCNPAWGDTHCPGVCARPPDPVVDPGPSYTLFESGQVRPLAKSSDGKALFAVNTPDGRLEVYVPGAAGLEHVDSIPVGVEPVAVAVRNDQEVWVVNHLSDSVSIVDVSRRPGRVVRTLLVGDEPRDIVFAGAGRQRAFITTAHRGQNAPFDPQLTTPGIGRADVWVFDAGSVVSGGTLGGTPLTILQLFTDTPRALAVSADGSRVYAAGFFTGNRTTVIPEEVVTLNGGLPPPTTNVEGAEQPPTSLIVKYDGEHWRDELGRQWDAHVKFSLPDKDVFVIDATANPPAQLAGSASSYSGVGTVLYGMAVNPQTGRVYVANTEALNEVRFEGAGGGERSSVQGHLHESRVTVLEPGGGGVRPRHLNKHIDYSTCCAPVPNEENARSLAIPSGLEVSSDGRTLYVAALGSSKVGVFSTEALENDTFTPSTSQRIQVSGGGPTGLILDEARQRLYVLTRFNNAIAVVDLRQGREIASVGMHSPEPSSITQGRPLLYDASLTSSHGDSSCASCHVFGDLDGLAWDLGDPDAVEEVNPGPFNLTPAMVGLEGNVNFRPLKGPMTTQSLRGMANHGSMHWRGDRTGGNEAPTAQPNGGTYDEEAAFKAFNPAFVTLLGRDAELSADQLQRFTDFALQITYPPNPIRNLDNGLTPSQQAGHDFYFNSVSDRLFTCNGCHVLDPTANAEFGVAKPGFFGGNGNSSFEFEPQMMKIPHFRNLYQKVGMFGMQGTSKLLPDHPDGQNDFMGEQIRGYGFLHDGSHDTPLRFLTTVLFRYVPPSPGDPAGNPGGFSLERAQGDAARRQVEDFLYAYDSNLAPVVGQQVTLSRSTWVQAQPRVDLLLNRAVAGECDLVARTSASVGYLYTPDGKVRSNKAGERPTTDAALRARVRQHGIPLTFTCVPRGSGVRLALDRDGDGFLDGDELVLGSDPSRPDSTPW
ncbi:hypothetical protein OV207_17610 [Corallococcus sp. BB11-1]|uniref:hypothetical protein n=1 Tax=Corallococcus sp. BB11-1 TaxID=2996783 RepID=UPI0022716CBF|nr:hypothetical protein [Corallococcus sp. BB11-1]MCY1033275.1 hypothetical protein [Corallococcus sp. BB11-1]